LRLLELAFVHASLVAALLRGAAVSGCGLVMTARLIVIATLRVLRGAPVMVRCRCVMKRGAAVMLRGVVS